MNFVSSLIYLSLFYLINLFIDDVFKKISNLWY